MGNRRLLRLSISLCLVGLAVSVLWVLMTGGFDALSGLAALSPTYLVPLLGLTSAHLLTRFFRWQFLLRCAGVRLPARASLVTFLASLVGIATPAYVGEVLRCVFARRKHGAPIGVTLAVLVVERLLDVAALGAIGVVCASGLASRVTMAAFVGAALLLGLGLVNLARRSAPPIARVAELKRLSCVLPAAILSLLAWAPAACTVSVAAWALHEDVGVVEGARIFSRATLFGGITLMPAGLGVTGSVAVIDLSDAGFTAARALPIVALFRWTTTGFALSLGVVFLGIELLGRRRAAAAGAAAHFDEIAVDYERQYSPHMWKLLLERKVELLASPLPLPPAAAGLGLDFGCGLGHQCLAMRERGYRVVGLDASRHLLRKARDLGAPVVAADGLSLPFPDASFDFVYAIGVLHHLSGPEAQQAACREVARVLKPGGRFLVHETNTRNPLFRFYMGYVFPLLKTIDEGTEQWIAPDRFQSAPGLRLEETRYFTFVPDTIPRPLLGFFLGLERRLENSWLRPYAVHYMAVLRRPDAAPAPASPTP